MNIIKLIFYIALLSSSSLHAEARNLKPLKTDSIEAIKQQHKDQSFAIALWSIDCPPCYEELEMLGKWLKNNPETNIIIISTDPIDTEKDAQHLLSEFKLENADNWIFAEPNTARLRHSIDPSWFGELPRSYLFDKQHHAYSHSGALNEKLLNKWVSLVSTKPKS